MESAQSYNRSLLRLLLINALIKPIWILGIDRWIQLEVGMADYGTYFSVWGLTLTAGFLLDLGLTTYVQRTAANDPGSASRLADLFWMKLLLVGVYLIVIAVIDLLYPSISSVLLWGVAGIQVLNSLYLYVRSWVTAAQYFSADVWFSILDKSLLIVLSIVWLSGIWGSIPINLDVFITCQLLTLSISIGVVVYFLIKHQLPLPGQFRFSWAWVCSAWPYAAIVLLMSALARLDGYWLTIWHANGAWEAGRFAAGYRLLDAANMFGYLVASFLLPYLARHRSDAAAVRSAITRARVGLMLTSLIAVLVLLIFVKPIAALLYPGIHHSVATVMPVILTALMGYSLTHVYGTVLTANGELRFFQRVIGFFLLVHVALSYCWIPEWGALGSARAALVSQLGTGLTLMHWVHRRNSIPQPISTYIVVIFTGCLVWILN